jgi:hypothetical protein
VKVDFFAEDRAHEQLVPTLIERVAAEEHVDCAIRIVSARGGHPAVARELVAYQRVAAATGNVPDLLIVSIDANCNGYVKAKKQYLRQLSENLRLIAVIAAPDPHVERWYLADQQACASVIGASTTLPTIKCDHHIYGKMLEDVVKQGGNTPTLRGLEFGPEIARSMDLYGAGKKDSALKSFVRDLRSRFKLIKNR